MPDGARGWGRVLVGVALGGLVSAGSAGCAAGLGKLGAKSARKGMSCGDDLGRGAARGASRGRAVSRVDAADVGAVLARLDDGAGRVAVALTKDGEPRMWVDLALDAADALLTLSEQPARIDQILLDDADCGETVGAGAGGIEALAQADGRVLLLAEGPLDPRLLEVARIADIQLVALAGDVCGADGLPTPEAAATLDRAQWARTWADVWAVGATGADPLVVADITGEGGWISLSGDGFAASAYDAGASATPPWWLLLAGAAAGGAVGAFVLVRRAR